MNILKLLLITPAILILGCSSTPEDAIYGMYDALKKGSLVELNKYTTERIAGSLSLRALKECKLDEKLYDKDNYSEFVNKCLVEMYGDVVVTNVSLKRIAEDKIYADIDINLKSLQEHHTYGLLDVGFKWKVAHEKR